MRGSRDIPSAQSNVIVNHTYRYGTAAGVSSTIDSYDILRAPGCVGVSSTKVRSIVQSARINYIEVWGSTPAPTTVGNFTRLTLLWQSNGEFANTSKEVTDVSVSVSKPPHIFSRPPQGTMPSFWLDETEIQQLFTISSTCACIIDVNVTYVLKDGSNSTSTDLTVTGATIAKLYYPALDSGASSTIIPVALTTIS